MAVVTLRIDGQEVAVPAGSSLLAATRAAGLALLVAESSAAFSLTLGPSKASRPRPRPLSFLVAMGVFLVEDEGGDGEF